MKDLIAGFAAAAVIVAGLIGAGTALGFWSLNMTQYFAPKYEAVRRDVMIESRAYSEATLRTLYKMKREYDAAQGEPARQTIAAAARHEFSIFPQERLPADLQVWMAQLNKG
jgi:hypothetical protein